MVMSRSRADGSPLYGTQPAMFYAWTGLFLGGPSCSVGTCGTGDMRPPFAPATLLAASVRVLATKRKLRCWRVVSGWRGTKPLREWEVWTRGFSFMARMWTGAGDF